MKANQIWRLVIPLILASAGLILFMHNVQASPLGNIIPVTTTIQAAIDLAQPGDIIDIPAGTYRESLVIKKTLILHGQGSQQTIIKPPSSQRAISATLTLRLENLAVVGGASPAGAGGGLLTDGNLQIIGCRFSGNTASYGGAIFQEEAGWIDVLDSEFISNSVTSTGGAIYASGNITLTNTDLLTNTAGLHGGGLHGQAGRVVLLGGLVQGNSASTNGGGVNLNNDVTVNGTHFVGNHAGQDG